MRLRLWLERSKGCEWLYGEWVGRGGEGKTGGEGGMRN